jgi:hypothetical protein
MIGPRRYTGYTESKMLLKATDCMCVDLSMLAIHIQFLIGGFPGIAEYEPW